METDDDETLPRDQNFLVEDETVETTMYDWEQAQSECDGLFNDTTAFPQSVKMEFTYDESALNIGLTWTVKNDTTNDDAMDYAVTMVKQFNESRKMMKKLPGMMGGKGGKRGKFKLPF